MQLERVSYGMGALCDQAGATSHARVQTFNTPSTLAWPDKVVSQGGFKPL